MNLSGCPRLSLTPLTGVWYRTVELRYLEDSLDTAHTADQPSRFSGGPLAVAPFQILYLCENTFVAHFEAGVILGSPWEPTGLVTRPGRAWADVNVRVCLQYVADLTQVSQQALIRTTVQELTGDWEGYQRRKVDSPVSQPGGKAPTQELGEALHGVPQLEGFLSVSSKVPSHRNLNVFPEKLQKGSSLVFEYTDRGILLEINPPTKRRRSSPR